MLIRTATMEDLEAVAAVEASVFRLRKQLQRKPLQNDWNIMEIISG